MSFWNPSNQLIQIDTGNALTYLWNKSQSPIQVYAALGEDQVLGQRYVGYNSVTASNPLGSPAIYVLAQYSSTANPAPTTAPAPVYWTDTTFTKVTGVISEAISYAIPAGYMLVNTTSVPGLTNTLLNGAYVLIQVAGYLPGAIQPASGTAGAGVPIYGTSGGGNWSATAGTLNTPTPVPAFGYALSAVSSGVFNILLTCDDF